MPVTPTVEAVAADTPALQKPADIQTIAACNIDSETSPAPLVSLQPFWSGMLPADYIPRFNMDFKAVELIAKYGAVGVYAAAYGLELSDLGGLLAELSTGLAMIDAPVEHIAEVGNRITLADNDSNYVWLKNNGIIEVVSSSLTPPSGKCLYRGRIDTAAGLITKIDVSGAWSLSGGVLYRAVGDVRDPGDTPPSVRSITATQAGTYLSDGAKYTALPRVGEQLPTPSNGSPEALVATKVLTVTSPNQLNFTCAAAQKVLMPPEASLLPGMWWDIYNYNAGGGADLSVRDSADSTTISTVVPGDHATIPVVFSGATPKLPASVAPAPTPSP